MHGIKSLVFFLRRVPDGLLGELASRIVNQLLRERAVVRQLWELNGKRIAIHVSDTNNLLQFIIKRGRLYRDTSADVVMWDVRIRGRLEHFWQLANRSEDPDTLFFQRRLEIEGDTVTGLYIKNLLDSLDYDWCGAFRCLPGLGAIPGTARDRP